MKKIITIAMIVMFLPLQSLYSKIMRFEIRGVNSADKLENLNPEKWAWLPAGIGARVDFWISNERIYRIIFYTPGTSNSSDKYATFEVTEAYAENNTDIFRGTWNNIPTEIRLFEEKSDGISYYVISSENKESYVLFFTKFIGTY